jgi:interferon-induced GTP-binding protein Mx1
VPGIVVAGAQSSGKSSLLESLSDITLPSGENITTRVPLILRLERQKDCERHAIIGETADLLPGTSEKISDLSKVPKKISEYTNKLAGNSGCVQDKPIHMKVVSPDGPTMTLIDLPGITHMSRKNVQEDIHEATVSLVKKYIQNEQMIILCVCPALDDFANSEAIKLAKEVDPEGKRTLGVITKVDLCKADTKIEEKLRGEENNVQLALGFIAVRNRTPDEVKKGINITKLRQNEEQFFNTSSHFYGIPKKYWGMNTLIDKISELQMSSVDEFIPKMLTMLKEKIGVLKFKVDQLAPEFNNDVQKMQHLVRIIVSVVAEFKALAKSYDDCDEEGILHISPRTFELYTQFSQELSDKQPDFYTEEYKEKIQVAINESRCIMLFNFMSHIAFHQLFIESHKKMYREVAGNLVDRVYDYIKTVLITIVKNKIDNRYIQLNSAIEDVVVEYINIQKELVLKNIHTIVDSESFIFTQNKEYADKIKDMNEPDAIKFLQTSLSSYSEVSVSRFRDYIPMQCHLFFVSNVYKHLHEFVDFEKMSIYLVDDENIKEKREESELSLTRFQKAYDILFKLKTVS